MIVYSEQSKKLNNKFNNGKIVMGNIMKYKKLSELKIGQRAKIVSLNILDKGIRRHLLDMGLTRGTIVEVKKIAPMGDPIDIALRSYELCIRKADLDGIFVEEIREVK